MAKKITKTLVDTTERPTKGQTIIWDTEITGFGLRLTPTRTTYVAQHRVSGKSVRVTLGSHGVLTPESARKMARKVLVGMLEGINPNAKLMDTARTEVTVGAAFTAYKKSRALAANTLRDYECAVRTAFPDWVDKPIRSINRDMIEARFDELSLKSHTKANQKFRFFRALLNFAMEKYTSSEGEPLIGSNPCNRLKALNKWHRLPRRTRYLTPEVLPAFFKALEIKAEDSATEAAFKDYCLLTLLTGCREQEAASVKWCNVDMKAGTVKFEKTKNGSAHTLPVGAWLMAALKRRAEGNYSAFVFPSDNKYGHIKYHHKAVLRLNVATGAEFRLHDFRRTFASVVNQQLAGRYSHYTIKHLLNHKTGDVTAGYIQISAANLREPMEQIERYFAGFAVQVNEGVGRH